VFGRLWEAYGAWKIARGLGAPWIDILRAQRSPASTVKVRSRLGAITLRPRNSDLYVLKQIFVDREYDISTRPQFAKLEAQYRQMLAASQIPVIVDAGANIGASAIWFADLFPEARVVAIEPDPANAELARVNTETRPNIEVIEAAIGAKPGFVSLAQGRNAWSVQTSRAETGHLIVTLSDAVKTVSDARIFIVKIDIEGFEADLFSSDLEWLDDVCAVFVEPHDWMLPGQGSSQSMQKAMLGRGRELLLVGENLLFV